MSNLYATTGIVNVKKCFCNRVLPCFNYRSEKADYCKLCKKEGMVDVKNKKCFCNRVQPSFNYVYFQPRYCKLCKLEGMINVRSSKYRR